GHAMRHLLVPAGRDGCLFARCQIEDVHVVIAHVGNSTAIGPELWVEDRTGTGRQRARLSAGAIENEEATGETEQHLFAGLVELKVGPAGRAATRPFAARLLLGREVLLRTFEQRIRRHQLARFPAGDVKLEEALFWIGCFGAEEEDALAVRGRFGAPGSA